MKFKIRQGFVVHHVTYVDVPDGNGGSTREEQRNSYYAGQNVDFDEAAALQHYHKLDPQDKDARAWLDARAVAFDAPAAPSAAGMSPADLAALVAQAVASAVASLQPAPAASVQVSAPAA